MASGGKWYAFYLRDGEIPRSMGGAGPWEFPKSYEGPFVSRTAADASISDELIDMTASERRKLRKNYRVKQLTKTQFSRVWGPGGRATPDQVRGRQREELDREHGGGRKKAIVAGVAVGAGLLGYAIFRSSRKGL